MTVESTGFKVRLPTSFSGELQKVLVDVTALSSGQAAPLEHHGEGFPPFPHLY